ncbi:hypothetical protein THAOC_35155 [Thalassiosira oceanica]|uniref:Uncharacterized protein n=1 Tax=Thalassiosira oceanica TaxID=159749 RepID=K0R3W4_THAOC|nr:hypothetical protein THAOC_35155 [Thalassiosira oceanica]|eukprot:EJK46189.1 hypothetical protein THAOC_35155 [Thalassiosira oceanica]
MVHSKVPYRGIVVLPVGALPLRHPPASRVATRGRDFVASPRGRAIRRRNVESQCPPTLSTRNKSEGTVCTMAPRQIDAVEAETRATSAASNLTTCVDAEHHGMIADGFALGDLAGVHHMSLKGSNSVREYVDEKLIDVVHVAGKCNPAEIFTKEMKDGAQFRRISGSVRDSFLCPVFLPSWLHRVFLVLLDSPVAPSLWASVAYFRFSNQTSVDWEITRGRS